MIFFENGLMGGDVQFEFKGSGIPGWSRNTYEKYVYTRISFLMPLPYTHKAFYHNVNYNMVWP